MKYNATKTISIIMVLILLLGALASCDGSCANDGFYKAEDVMHQN